MDGQRILYPWHTSVPLNPCPRRGQPYAPEVMAFLRKQVETSERLWGLCPACQRKAAAAQLDVVRGAKLWGNPLFCLGQ